MQAVSNIKNLLSPRFFYNFMPIPATSKLAIGRKAPEFVLPDITNRSTVRLSDYQGQKKVILAFTRIFTEKFYCPLCYPHIVELNEQYKKFTEKGVEVFMIASTDTKQSQRVINDLGLKMPLLSNPRCDVFRTYETGQALGAPLPAQFVINLEGKLTYKHLFSFLEPNATIERLLKEV